MLPLSARELIRFTPPGFKEGDPAAPVYLLRVPTILTREQYKRARTQLGMRIVTEDDLRTLLKAVLPEVLPEADVDAARADIDRLAELAQQAAARVRPAAPEVSSPPEGEAPEDASGAPSDPVPTSAAAEDAAWVSELTAVAARVAQLIDHIRREVPAYPKAEADAEYFWNMARTLAAQHFLAGWEQPDGLPFETGRDGLVTLECLSQIDPLEVFAVGLRALELMNVTRTQRKN